MDDNQSPQNVNKKKLFLGNLSWDLSQDDIQELCAPFGDIVEVNLITDQRSGRSKGFAFVEYSTEEEAKAAMDELNEKEVDGRNMFVKYAQPKKPRRDFRGRDNRRSDRN